jgi:hypothetical protein
VFERLSREDTLDTALADRLKDAVGQRNLLVHGYVDLDPALIWEKLGEVEDLREFAGWLSQRRGPDPSLRLNRPSGPRRTVRTMTAAAVPPIENGPSACTMAP